jgi:RNA-directed DNA polymerase
MARLEDKIADGPVLRLIESFLKADILDEASRWTPDTGAPQGAVLSPLLSNVYLDPLDHLLAEQGFEMVRYADDFVILCRSADDAKRALELARQWVCDNGLTLHPTKTRIVDARTEGFDYLGYTFRGAHHWPRDKSLAKLRDSLRPKTSRTSGDSLQFMVREVNRTLRGWFEYFQHSTYHNVFTSVDGWVRMRLRSVLRKRHGGKGRGRGKDHNRWPNRFFAERGLYSLAAAHAAAGQSSSR